MVHPTFSHVVICCFSSNYIAIHFYILLYYPPVYYIIWYISCGKLILYLGTRVQFDLDEKGRLGSSPTRLDLAQELLQGTFF